jgi:hypothetical protein
VHYFTPEPASVAATPAPARRVVSDRIELTVGRVTSSAHLRHRIVSRESAYELTAYDDLRWTEYPEAYARRSLTKSLFGGGSLVQTIRTDRPTLDVELIAFEEVRRGNARAGRVQLEYRLRDEREVLASGVVTTERDAALEEGMAPVVEALAVALAEASGRVAEAVELRLARYPSR